MKLDGIMEGRRAKRTELGGTPVFGGQIDKKKQHRIWRRSCH